MWEKEKMLVVSNFSFFHSVFKILILQACKTQGLFGKGLTSRLSYPLLAMFSQYFFFRVVYCQGIVVSMIEKEIKYIIAFYAPAWKDRGAYCFTVVRLHKHGGESHDTTTTKLLTSKQIIQGKKFVCSSITFLSGVV